MLSSSFAPWLFSVHVQRRHIIILRRIKHSAEIDRSPCSFKLADQLVRCCFNAASTRLAGQETFKVGYSLSGVYRKRSRTGIRRVGADCCTAVADHDGAVGEPSPVVCHPSTPPVTGNLLGLLKGFVHAEATHSVPIRR